MTDHMYGTSGTPSSRPPEPPYRSNASTQPVYSGQQQYASPDTSGIDRTGEVPATGQYAPIGSSYPTESFGNASMGDTATMPNVGASGNAVRHGAVAQHTYQAPAQAPAPQPAKQKSGAGKSFVFGFLGALVACALAIGGFAVWQGTQGAPSAAAVLGTSDPSVINAVDEGQTIAEAVAAKALPSVVAVYNYTEQQSYGYGFGYGYGNNAGGDSGELVASGMGSGVVISDDGYIITNYHVVEGATELTVAVDGIERDAELVGADSSSDIAVVKVSDTEGLVAADIGDSDSLKIGEWVMTIGAPLGLEQSVATGVVSATNRSTIMDLSSSSDEFGYLYGYGSSTPEYAYYPNMIQTDALINPGNSGGALVDADGKLVGINSMLSSYSGDYAGVGFAIPINYAIGLAEDIIAGKEPTHAALGVSISQVNSQTAKRYNLSATSGAYIAGIYEGSGAADSDLQVGDIITAIDGKPVTSTTDVTLDVRGYDVGDTVIVTVDRNGETIDVPVTLGSDENLASAVEESNQQQQQYPYGEGYGDGSGDGYGMEDLERLLRMLGM